MKLEEVLEKSYPKEARIKDAKEISENYGRLQEIKEKMVELFNNNQAENKQSRDIRELAEAIIGLTQIVRELEMERVIEEGYRKKNSKK